MLICILEMSPDLKLFLRSLHTALQHTYRYLGASISVGFSGVVGSSELGAHLYPG